MKLKPVSVHLEDYLAVREYANYKDLAISKLIDDIRHQSPVLEEQGRTAFEFVRDQIRHSFDYKGTLVTISATQTLQAKEGICFAKSHLLAALLRGLGIPTGFCYQRVMRKGTIESGFALHGLNAVYFESHGWRRVDPRGNKPEIHSEFVLNQEQLAYTLDTAKGEADDPRVFSDPLPEVIRSMKTSATVEELFYNRPQNFPFMN